MQAQAKHEENPPPVIDEGALVDLGAPAAEEPPQDAPADAVQDAAGMDDLDIDL